MKNLVFSNTLAALPAARSPGWPTNTVMCQDRMIPVSSSAFHSGSQRRIVELRVDVGDHQRDLAHAASWRRGACNSSVAPSGFSGSIGTPISRSGAAAQNSSSQSL